MYRCVSTGSASEGVFHRSFFADPDIANHWVDIEVYLACDEVYAIPEKTADGNTENYLIKDLPEKNGRLKLLNPDGSIVPLKTTGLYKIRPTRLTSPSCLTYVPVAYRMSLMCPTWPEVATEWMSRERLEGWPARRLLETIPKNGCLIEPCLQKKSNVVVEWRYTFPFAENTLFQEGMSQNQKYCYLTLAFLFIYSLKCEKAIRVRVLKHTFFYACERIPSEFFQTSPGSCILYMLDQIQDGFLQGRIPNYFIPADNLISHLSSTQLKDIHVQLKALRAQPHVIIQQINDTNTFCTKGTSIISNVLNDIEIFKVDTKVKESVVQTFVPCLIDIAKDRINTCFYDMAFELLNQVFQDRLAVSTCDDSVLYHQFLQGSLSGLPMIPVVWFCTYADKLMSGQLAKTMIREMCGDMSLTSIDKVLPTDIAGAYGSSEVPTTFVSDFALFCHDYAAFLVFTVKLSDAQSVLYHCAEQYRSAAADRQGSFDDFTMFYIYSGLYSIYSRQGQLELFGHLVGEMGEVAKRLNRFDVCCCLQNIYLELGDIAHSREFATLKRNLSQTGNDAHVITDCRFWPRVYLMPFR